MTVNLIGLDGKLIREKRLKKLQSSSDMSVYCDIPRDGFFGIRLSSSPLPFDIVVKVWLDGIFWAGRCFLSGNSEPIIEYDIFTIQKESQCPGDISQTKFSKLNSQIRFNFDILRRPS